MHREMCLCWKVHYYHRRFIDIIMPKHVGESDAIIVVVASTVRHHRLHFKQHYYILRVQQRAGSAIIKLQ